MSVTVGVGRLGDWRMVNGLHLQATPISISPPKLAWQVVTHILGSVGSVPDFHWGVLLAAS